MSVAECIRTIRERIDNRKITTGLVLGSGLAGLADAVNNGVTIPYSELPGFPEVGVSGHDPNLIIGEIEGVTVAVFAGRAHYYEHARADVMRTPLAVLKGLGAKRVILANSAGSLRDDIPPGELMLISDHINLAGANPLIGETGDDRFVDMVDAYEPSLRQAAMRAAANIDIELASGVYAWLSGPCFETPAEIRALKILGADAVGMSTVPEVILARFFGLKVAGISNITNMAAGMDNIALSHEQTKKMANQSAARFEKFLKAFLKEI